VTAGIVDISCIWYKGGYDIHMSRSVQYMWHKTCVNIELSQKYIYFLTYITFLTSFVCILLEYVFNFVLLILCFTSIFN